MLNSMSVLVEMLLFNDHQEFGGRNKSTGEMGYPKPRLSRISHTQQVPNYGRRQHTQAATVRNMGFMFQYPPAPQHHQHIACHDSAGQYLSACWSRSFLQLSEKYQGLNGLIPKGGPMVRGVRHWLTHLRLSRPPPTIRYLTIWSDLIWLFYELPEMKFEDTNS